MIEDTADSSAANQVPVEPAATARPTVRQAGPAAALRDTCASLLAGVGVLLFLPAARRLTPGRGQTLLWLVLGLLNGIGLTWLFYHEPVRFNAQAIPMWLIPPLALLAMAAAVEMRTLAHGVAQRVLIAFCVTDIALGWLLYLAWPWLPGLWPWPERLDEGRAVVLALQLWQGLALTLAGARLLRGSGGWRWAVMLSMLVLTAWLQQQLHPSFWQWDEAAAAARRPPRSAPADEATLYRQPALLQQQLGTLLPQRPGVVDLYVLAIAGDAGEPVFQREVQHVQRLLDSRFDSRGRSLLLINHEATRERIAIASQTSMRAALQRIGQLADPAEDIVLVYLTSHGSASHEFVLDYHPLPLEGLRPHDLATMLQQAGIGYRAVIVSACYSGGFVPALKHRLGLVMTAADADSTSFGCGADTHYTWFGQALFRHALSQTRSLEHGFQRARQQIVRWEQRDRLQPSNPQLHVSPAFRQQWLRLEQQLLRQPATLPCAAPAVKTAASAALACPPAPGAS